MVASVVMTITEVGVAIDVQERLERAGHQVTWQADANPQTSDFDVIDNVIDVVLIGNCHGNPDQLSAAIEMWRATPSAPAIMVLGDSKQQAATTDKSVVWLTSTTEGDGLLALLEKALSNRFTHELSLHTARAALALPIDLEDMEAWSSIISAGRHAPAALVRDALAPFTRHYVQANPQRIAKLRQARALDVPEIELTQLCTGTKTLRHVVRASRLTGLEAGQRLWALASTEAIHLTSAPRDGETLERRKLIEWRTHLRKRTQTALITAYDVLSVNRGVHVDDVEKAVRELGFRFAPQVTATLDLGDCEDLTAPIWEKILQARSALYYEAGQAELNAFIDAQPSRFTTSWGHSDLDHRRAKVAFVRGTQALSESNVYKALSDMASAARCHPNHPIYESYLAWTRYRAEVARGGDRRAAARKERLYAEAHTYGQRPFAQALVALGLLCVADGDPASARWHLSESLAIDPDLPAAKIILSRLQ